ncbi:carboxypeptidase-like regulatory domain-containing protein [Flavobacterium caeni]|uniref:Carboxypeptidase regulatory-like domain-containing protein n=1 Tax=Flavobacterium caeni TaxID=490189 RepID=A0A1G5D352_9FLAO|nr:carboxypeptidase-like regulatory domain-containing protein [Flavobacterium caeni]SCY09064.1 hypothetical protein SAMN02927903_00727 [Flavobacterium caeni]
MNKIYTYCMALLVMLSFSCSSEDKAAIEIPTPPNSSTVDLSGRVVDENGNAVAGAQVTSGDRTATSGASGSFTIQATVSNDRGFVRVSKAGYFESFRGFQKASETGYIEVVLAAKATSVVFESSTGASLTNHGGTVDIPANGLKNEQSGVDYSGQVTADVRFFSPDDEGFATLMQGGDFIGINQSGQTGSLKSYGFFAVELYAGNGDRLNLKDGVTATVRFDIAPSQQISAPVNMPLWHFDEQQGIWKEDGAATKIGLQYQGAVSHFSYWNFDILYPNGTLKGKVVCYPDQTPYAHQRITISNGPQQLYTYTNWNGEFQVDYPAGFAVEVIAEGTFYGQSFDVPPLVAGQLYEMAVHSPYCETNSSFTFSGANYPAFGFAYASGTCSGNINVELNTFTPGSAIHFIISNMPTASSGTFAFGNYADGNYCELLGDFQLGTQHYGTSLGGTLTKTGPYSFTFSCLMKEGLNGSNETYTVTGSGTYYQE